MITSITGGFTSELDAILADLVNRFLQRVQAGEAIDPDTFAAEHPEYAAALRDVLPAAAALADFQDSERSASIPPIRDGVPEAGILGDFRITREVGRGGMGVVYEAEQISLRRRVALKILPVGAARDPRQLARFHVEAHAIATLNHPNIVPIFAVGSDRGVHFYAMQFIEGRSLAEVIAERRQDREKAGQDDPGLSLAEAARLGLQAAEAIGHAHAMGILHRDIKPANMLVDGRGHLWIVNFGLARMQAESDLTGTGDLCGTLRYMSPEQALGHGMLDGRSDIYSLGASLYELLVLRPAFDGRDRQQLLRQIADDEPVAPRKLDRRIARDLETIILKATIKEPSGRYQSAQELGEDLRRFLQGAPILSRPPGPYEQVGRWMRRHRSAVATAAGIVLLALVGLAAGNLMLWEERSRTKENLELALRALDSLHVYLGEEGLNTNPEQAGSILNSLQADLALYARLSGQNPHNQEARWGSARAHRRMGDIHARSSTAKLDEAEASYRVADALLAELLASDPSNLSYREEHALLLGNWGKLVYLVGGNRAFRGSLAAEGPLRRSLEIDRGLIAEHPAETRYRRRSAQNALYLIGVLFIADRTVERERWLAEAQSILRDVQPDSPADQLDLVVVHKLLGDVLHATGRPEEGAQAYFRSIALLESLPSEPLPSQAYRRSVIEVFGRLGQQSFCSTSQPSKEMEYFARALPAWDLRVAGIDLTAAEQRIRARAHQTMGYLFENNRRHQEAIKSLLRAGELGETLFKAHPSVLEYRKALADNSRNLGRLLMTAGCPTEALRSFDRAIELMPESDRIKENAVWSLVMYPNPRPARAVAIAEQLVKAHPDQPAQWSRLGQARIRAGDWTRGQEALEHVIRTADGGGLDDWLFMAMARRHLGDAPSARRWYDKAAVELDGSTAPRDPAIDHLRREMAGLIGVPVPRAPVRSRPES